LFLPRERPDASYTGRPASAKAPYRAGTSQESEKSALRRSMSKVGAGAVRPV